ncbi:MAG: replicative DNA helicase [Nitrospinae bacterium]|nr:replicative DNA helicase [Nitrospinota bacterium]
MSSEPQPINAVGVGRVPPQNVEAEQSVLGGILFDNAAMARAAEHLKTGEEFYRPGHRLIYAAYLDLYEKGEPIDMMTVAERLRKKKQLDEAGGLDYLAQLMELIPTAANVGIHAKIVKEKLLLRKLITTAAEVVSLGYEDSEEVDEVIDRAERMIFDLAEERIQKGFRNIKEVVNDTIKDIERLFDRKELITGLATGYRKFDEMTAGYQPGDLIIMAGRPSMGKTAICINMAEYMAIEQEKAVAFFSLEMGAMQLILRMISSLSHISMHKIRTGYLAQNDWPRITSAAQHLYEAKIHIDDSPVQSVLDIRSKARRLKAEGALDIIIIDYLQLMHGRANSESRVLEISEITRGLKGLARELNVPVIAISQLSRKVEERPNKRPMLADLRESGSIEQDADIVSFVYREEYYNPDKNPGLAEVIIAKQRNGPVGTVQLAFNKECTRFDNPAFDAPQFDTELSE